MEPASSRLYDLSFTATISSQTPSRPVHERVTDSTWASLADGAREAKAREVEQENAGLLTRLFRRLSRINVTDCAAELFARLLEVLVLPGRLGGQLAATAAG